jgi:pimeloyl-ACP methyl ester carboxylesterase
MRDHRRTCVNRALQAHGRWVDDALAQTPDEGRVDVEGAAIHWLAWGREDDAGVVLVHGGAAHAHWWSFLAPLLAHRYRVVAIDLSGHGDSGWRESYSVRQWAREVPAAATDAGIHDRFVLVGHSMGGFVSMVAAALYGQDLLGALIVDSPVRRPDPESEEGARGRAFRNPKRYTDLATAMSHFHLIPPQPVTHPDLVEHVARTSLRRVAGSNGEWTWKFDPKVFDRTEPIPLHEYLATVRCRVAVLYGELSNLVTPDVSDYMHELLGRNAPFVEIPQAHHHVFLDQPLAFVAAVRALLADWEHTVPTHRTDRAHRRPPAT